MKVAYLIHSLCNSGGTERVLTEKANYLAEVLGYDVTIITSRQKGLPPFFDLSNKIKTIDINANFYGLFTKGRYKRKLAKTLFKLKPDICISMSDKDIHFLKGIGDGSVKMAEFHFSHDYLFQHVGNSLKAILRTRRLEKSASGMSAFVVLTKEDQAVWKKLIPDTLQIYNPTPFDSFDTAKLDSHHALAVGRFTKQKNFKELVRIWATVSAKHPDWTLDIYGSGPQKKEIEADIIRAGLSGKVILHSPCRNIKAEMLSSSMFLSTSIYEGFPMTLAEAATLGLPLVGTNCPCGPSEIIRDGVNGYIVQIGQTEVFADRVCLLIENVEQRKQMGAASVEEAKKLSKPVIMKQWDNLFKSLVESKSADYKPEHKICLNLLRAKIAFLAHVLNPVWLSREERRKNRGKSIEKTVVRYMKDNYLHAADRITPGPVSADTEGEKIFSIWFQGEKNAPQLVKSCLNSIRRNCRQELVVLDENTIFDYISLPHAIVQKFKEGKIKYCHFADICRVELLYRYGGFWIDATCFLTGSIPEFICKEDFFTYMSGDKVHGNYSYIQNCFIRAKKGSYLLEAWRAIILAYWMNEDKRLEYFQHQLMFKTLVCNNPTAKTFFDKMPQLDQFPTHILWYRDSDLPYNPALIEEINRQGFFFQKTTYRDSDKKLVPGSFRDWIINGER